MSPGYYLLKCTGDTNFGVRIGTNLRHQIWCPGDTIFYSVGYSVIVALTGLPIGYSVIIALTDLPIGYSVIVVLTGLLIGYSVIVALTGLPIGYSIKTHGSESRGQEEAACMRVLWPTRPLQ